MAGCQYKGKSFGSCTITIDIKQNSNGTLRVEGQNPGEGSPTTLLTTDVVVGGNGHWTPTGTFHASHWEHDHVSTQHLPHESVPYSKSITGDNAFGPYQLHILELESRGIYIHGTIGPSWNPFTVLNSLVSPTSHGCVRMSNLHNVELHNMMSNPKGNLIIIKMDAAR